MPKLIIDGKEVEVPKGTRVIEAAKQLDIDIPYYCYHPGLSIAGNCRASGGLGSYRKPDTRAGFAALP